ncbi:MAG: glutamine amidotransferase [Microbacteriaceae bacterium]|nr:glutamine amidotransferase [Microbacteriaceae bacterium]
MPDHKQKILTVSWLYPREMNLYGDTGNALALMRRIQQHGYAPIMRHVHPEQEIPAETDIVIGGGGQDSGQLVVAADLKTKADSLHALAESGTPMLMICGLYQLFGHRFVTLQGQEMRGIGLLDVETLGGSTRMIGNIVLDTEKFGKVIGYENHSGATTLGANAVPFGRVLKGAGNNPDGEHEGAVWKEVIGTYLHGSLLPKNPRISDGMIAAAATKRYGEFVPREIDDTVVEKARAQAASRPR